MTLRLAVVISHPIQHFAPWHREVVRRGVIDLRVFFCCDWGVHAYHDQQFGKSIQWDIPLVDGYAHEFLPIAKRPKQLTLFEVDNPTVGEALARFRPDVVKVLGYAHLTQLRAMRWARRHGKPVLMYSDSNLKRRRRLAVRLAKEVVVRALYSHVDGALYVGDSNWDYHRYYGVPADRMFPGMLPIDRDRLVNSVVDRDAARREIRSRFGIPDDAFVVGFCGKLMPHKRPKDLVQAVAGLDRPPGKPIWALLVGEGPERAEVERALAQAGARNAIITGFVNQTQIAAHFIACDVLAVISRLDSHPLVVTEAASFGLPIVASDALGCVGNSDTVQDGVNALVYPCGDIAQLRSAIVQMRDDREMYAKLSKGALAMSLTQDTGPAADALADAAEKLHRLGPR